MLRPKSMGVALMTTQRLLTNFVHLTLVLTLFLQTYHFALRTQHLV